MKPTNHVTNLKCFESVASVIGNMEAQRQLFIVITYIAQHEDLDFEDHKDISVVFTWEATPQGHQYWENIYTQWREESWKLTEKHS